MRKPKIFKYEGTWNLQAVKPHKSDGTFLRSISLATRWESLIPQIQGFYDWANS